MRGQPLKRSGSDVEGEALRKCEEARKGNKVRGLSIREALAMQTFYRKLLNEKAKGLFVMEGGTHGV